MTSRASEMPFLEHLGELRSCLGRALVGIAITGILCFLFSGELFSVLTAPLIESFTEISLVGLNPAEAFVVKLKVALVGGIVLASPFSFWQLWIFIEPGLHREEQSYALPFVALTTICFLVGITFCYLVILPFAFDFFLKEFQSIAVEPTIRIGEYLSFVVKLLLVFGLVFELPVLTWFLARIGLVTPSWLKKNARFVLVGIFILAAILTPPDIITQLLLALPLTCLYGLCILVAGAAKKK